MALLSCRTGAAFALDGRQCSWFLGYNQFSSAGPQRNMLESFEKRRFSGTPESLARGKRLD
jgi:hypothetical protein